MSKRPYNQPEAAKLSTECVSRNTKHSKEGLVSGFRPTLTIRDHIAVPFPLEQVCLLFAPLVGKNLAPVIDLPVSLSAGTRPYYTGLIARLDLLLSDVSGFLL